MLFGLTSIVFALALGIWTLIKNVGNRFTIGLSVMVLFFPLELLTTSFPEYFISKISPYAIYTFTVFVIYLCAKLSSGKNILITPIFSITAAFVMGILILTIARNGYVGLGTIFDNYMAPTMALFILANERHRITTKSSKKIIMLICIAAVYGTFEFAIKKNILLESVFAQMSWISTQWNESFHRSTSTIGHPLIAATIYLMGLALLETTNKKYWLYTSMLIVGVLSTGSRAGVVISIAVILSKHVRLRLKARDALGLSAMGIMAFIAYAAGLFDQILGRFINGEGSTAVRTALFEFIPGIIRDNFIGHGIGASGVYAGEIGFYNAIEIPWIALIIELGVACLLYTSDAADE